MQRSEDEDEITGGSACPWANERVEIMHMSFADYGTDFSGL